MNPDDLPAGAGGRGHRGRNAGRKAPTHEQIRLLNPRSVERRLAVPVAAAGDRGVIGGVPVFARNDGRLERDPAHINPRDLIRHPTRAQSAADGEPSMGESLIDWLYEVLPGAREERMARQRRWPPRHPQHPPQSVPMSRPEN